MKYENNKIVYEVGDWVTINQKHHTENGKTGKLTIKPKEGKNLWRSSNLNDGFAIYHFRPATQEEINSVTKEEKIMVGDSEVDFGNARGDQLDYIKVGCIEVSKETLLKIGKKAQWI